MFNTYLIICMYVSPHTHTLISSQTVIMIKQIAKKPKAVYHLPNGDILKEIFGLLDEIILHQILKFTSLITTANINNTPHFPHNMVT